MPGQKGRQRWRRLLAGVLLVVFLDALGQAGEMPDRQAVVRTLQRALAVREARLETVRAAWTEAYFLSPAYAAQLRAYHKIDVLPADGPIRWRWQWARHGGAMAVRRPAPPTGGAGSFLAAGPRRDPEVGGLLTGEAAGCCAGGRLPLEAGGAPAFSHLVG